MSIKQNLQAIYSRFPTPSGDPPAHFVALHDDEMLLVIDVAGNFYPFAVTNDDFALDPAAFVTKIESAARAENLLDILDS